MKRYTYRAKDKTGKLVTGEVEAATTEIAARLVRKNNLVVISIKPARRSLSDYLNYYRNRITTGDVANFTRQMATMIGAGLSISDSLVILREQSRGNMREVVAQLLADVEGGESLSSAFSKHPKVFTPIYIALIKSGEVGGVLDEVVLRLAENLEKQEEFKAKVKTALIYPTVIVVGMIAVGIIMMIFVIPRLTEIYSEFQTELPLPTRILIGISNITATFWPVFILLGIGAFFGFRAYRNTKEGRRKTDKYLFELPIIGRLQKQIILTEMTRTMSLMVGSGVSILESLTVTASVAGNVVISDAIDGVAKSIEKGFPVAYSFARHPDAFPFLLSQMISVGEETGKIDEVLKKVSHVFEIESDQEVKAITAAVEPFVMVVLGLGVGFLVIAIILPIYNLTSKF